MSLPCCFDSIGNIIQMKHMTQYGGWTRKYEYETMSNKLRSTSVPGDDLMLPLPTRYQYDNHGNIAQMPHLSSMTWDPQNQLLSTSKQLYPSGTNETTYYINDNSGQRLRKITENQALSGNTPTKKNERLYLGHWELFREYGLSNQLELERESLHVMDDTQRVALVETKTTENGSTLNSPTSITRLQLEDHLDSCSLEVTGDRSASVLTYEEHHPFGTSSYQAKNLSNDVSMKRYRYTGKERDEENGFSYHGARYYAPWLARWTTPDPAGMIDGVNLCAYVKNNPVEYRDPDGMQRNSSNQNITLSNAVQKDLALAKGTGPFTDQETKRRGDLAEQKGIKIIRSFGGNYFSPNKKGH